MALGVMLVVAVLVIHSVVYQSFHRGGEGYDIIAGANKEAAWNWSSAACTTSASRSRTFPTVSTSGCARASWSDTVELAIPICLGDNYEGYRVVGTTPEMFDQLRYLGDQEYKFAEGANFEEKNFFDAVIGATVARKANLKLGDTFRPTHDVAGQTHESIAPSRSSASWSPPARPTTGPCSSTSKASIASDITPAMRRRNPTKRNPVKESRPKRNPVSQNPTKRKHAEAKSEDGKHEEPKHDAKSEHAEGKPDADHDDDHDHDEHAIIPEEMKRVTAVLVCVDQKRPGATRDLAKRINQETSAPGGHPFGRDRPGSSRASSATSSWCSCCSP